MSSKVAIQTFGCRSNFSDTVSLQARLIEQGFLTALGEDDADVIVVNTCTVTDEADRTSRQAITKLRQRFPDKSIVVTGCMAETAESDALIAIGASAVIGPGRQQALVEAVQGVRPAQGAHSAVTEQQAPVVNIVRGDFRAKRARYAEDQALALPASLRGPGVVSNGEIIRQRYHLRVQEGCENSCTFCIIPVARGALVSRAVEVVLNDVSHLTQLGYGEIVLSGTHLGGYGEDINSSLLELLQRIVYRLDELSRTSSQVPRIRLSSIDPNELTPEIIRFVADSSHLCEHLHICLQALDDRLLKRMNRRYALEEAMELIGLAAETMGRGQVGTDLITGFPGETRADVEKQLAIFERLPLSYAHVFPYSERQGTPALRLPDSVPFPERKRRAARWRSASQQKEREFLERLIGKELEVVVEPFGPASERLGGTSREFAAVEFELSAIEHSALVGQTVRARARALNPANLRLSCRI